MKPLSPYVISLSILLISFHVQAGSIYKCINAKGAVAYSTQKCDGDGSEIKLKTREPTEDEINAKKQSNASVRENFNKKYSVRNTKRKIKQLKSKIVDLQAASEKRLGPLKEKYENQRYNVKYKSKAARTKSKIDSEEKATEKKVKKLEAEIKGLEKAVGSSANNP